MSHSVWRIATDARTYEADDLGGTGAKISGGRWNEVGQPMVYAAESIALACLETCVHLDTAGLPFNRFLVRIDMPDAVWQAAEILTEATTPIGWNALPYGRASLAFGTAWLREKRSACLVVPSIIAPEESNILINPAHADAADITATKLRRWLYDPRLGPVS